jgi:rod shape determining protein RodA
MMLYSTGNKEVALLIRQSTRMGIAGVLMIVLAHVDPRQFQRFSILLYSIGVILLVAVLLVGDVGKGAQRWLDLGVFRFQPSEMIKITTPMMIAWYLSGHEIPAHKKLPIDRRKRCQTKCTSE